MNFCQICKVINFSQFFLIKYFPSTVSWQNVFRFNIRYMKRKKKITRFLRPNTNMKFFNFWLSPFFVSKLTSDISYYMLKCAEACVLQQFTSPISSNAANSWYEISKVYSACWFLFCLWMLRDFAKTNCVVFFFVFKLLRLYWRNRAELVLSQSKRTVFLVLSAIATKLELSLSVKLTLDSWDSSHNIFVMVNRIKPFQLIRESNTSGRLYLRMHTCQCILKI